MKFKSAYHGEIQYSEKEIITFNNGIPGFPGLSKYVLVDIEENPMFKVIHSLEDEKVSFIVVSPFLIKENYEIKLTEELIKGLEIEKPEDTLVYNTVTLNNDPKKITTNLRAPLVINTKNNLGEQLILNNEEYEVKHPLVKE